MSSSRFRAPDPRDRLLVRAAVLPGPPAVSAWREWFSGVVLDELPFDEARLLPRVFANLAAQGATDCLPPRLRGKYRWVWTSNQLRCHAVAPALQALVDAAIPTLLLKGAGLLATGRCPWGAREMGDVDILVPPGRGADAASVLDAAGWFGLSGITPEFVARRLGMRRHAWNYVREAPQENLDLHWHAFEGLRVADIDAKLFERARRVRFGSVDLLSLDDVDHALHTIEHASYNEPAHRLMWIVDVASLLGDLDGAVLAHRARELGIHDLTREALDAVATTLATPSIQAMAGRLAVCHASRRERLLAKTEGGAILGRPRPRLSELVRTAVVNGAEPSHPVRGVSILVERRLEPSLCAHPLLSAALALFGRPRRAQVATLRVLGPLARPPKPRPLVPGEWVELTTADALDRVAGAGWSWPTPEGVWTDGAEARLAIDVAVPRGRPLALEFRFGDDAHLSQNVRSVALVNGRPVAHWTFGTTPEHTPQRLAVPAWLGDWCRPIDVAIRPLMPFMPRNRGRGLGDIQRAVQLKAVRVVEA